MCRFYAVIHAHFISNSCHTTAVCCNRCDITLFFQFCNFFVQFYAFCYGCGDFQIAVQIQFVSAKVRNHLRNCDRISACINILNASLFQFYITIACPCRLIDKAFHDLRVAFARANKVVACVHFVHRYRLSAAPVCHDHAFESPFVSCKCGTKIIVIRCRSSVILVVGGHNRHRLCLFYNHFETFEVDLTDCSFRNGIILFVSACFLRIQCVVFDGNTNTFALLYAECCCCAGHTYDYRIFRIIFKVTSAECVSVDIHTRCQPGTDTKFFHFFANAFAVSVDLIGIPGLCKQCTDRPCGCILVIGLIAVFVFLCNTKTCRSVRQVYRSDAFCIVSPGRSCHTSNGCIT